MQRGVTLIEIVIVIAIFAAFSGAVFIAYKRFNSYHSLDKSRDELVSLLEEARTLTLSSKENSQYGVHIDATEAILFTGDTFMPGAIENVAISYGQTVTATATLAGGGANVIFERLSGRTANEGNITLSSASATTTKSIIIYPSGLVEKN